MDTALVLIQLLPQQLLNGVTIGAVYALIALGYTMVYGVLQLINFAHGDLFMLGAMTGTFMLAALGLTAPLPLGLAFLVMVAVFIVSMAAVAGLGVAIERVAYKPLRAAGRLSPLLWLTARWGYDRRAWPAQTLMTWILVLASYAFTRPADNVNWAFGPGARPQTRLPPRVYLGLAMIVLALSYWPVHALLAWLFRRS